MQPVGTHHQVELLPGAVAQARQRPCLQLLQPFHARAHAHLDTRGADSLRQDLLQPVAHRSHARRQVVATERGHRHLVEEGSVGLAEADGLPGVAGVDDLVRDPHVGQGPQRVALQRDAVPDLLPVVLALDQHDLHPALAEGEGCHGSGGPGADDENALE